jgi:hypothetical protein
MATATHPTRRPSTSAGGPAASGRRTGIGAGPLAPWGGLGLFAGYTAALLGVTGYVLHRRA